MHDTALDIGNRFFSTYTQNARGLTIVEIGSQDVNGSLRTLAPPGNNYVGVDFVPGNGVDVVLDDPYLLPFEDVSIDVCVCSSCFEHSEFFWLLYNEILRILKPSGIFYLNAPSNGNFHRYPVDCWRFYPDSGTALQNWGRRSGYRCTLLESFIARQQNDNWNDFVAVFVKDEAHADKYPFRIQDMYKEHMNGIAYKTDYISNLTVKTQDQHQRDLLACENEVMVTSLSWKITKPLRRIRSILKF